MRSNNKEKVAIYIFQEQEDFKKGVDCSCKINYNDKIQY